MDDQSKSPPIPPYSYSAAGIGYSFFLGSYFFFGSYFFLGYYFLAARVAAGAEVAPSLFCPSAMSWWTDLPLRVAMRVLISASSALHWTLPITDLISSAATL